MKTKKLILLGFIMMISSMVMAQITITVNSLPTMTETDATITEPSCGNSNGEISLPEIPGYIYEWDTDPVQTTATITGLAAGNYTCKVINEHNCFVDLDFNLSDSDGPTVTLAASDSEICDGESVTFAVTGVADNYEFFVAGVSVQNGPENTFTTDILVDGDVVVVVGTDENGCTGTSNEIIMTVNPLPVIVVEVEEGPTACGAADGEITLSGGETYSWSNGENTATITGLSAGTYTCIVANLSGCTETITITLSDPGAITPTLIASDTEICDGEEVIFTVTEVADSYNFLVNGASVQDGASNTYTTTTLVNNDVVSVIATVTGCTGASDEIIMTVNALPEAIFGADASICAGDEIDLVVTPSLGFGLFTITMQNGIGDLVDPTNDEVIDVSLGSSAIFSVRPTSTTTYHFIITDERGCSREY